MQVFGKNMFLGDKEKNVFVKSDKIEEEEGPNLLATLKNTATDLGNRGPAIKTNHNKHLCFSCLALTLSPTLLISPSSLETGHILTVLTIGALLSVLFMFFVREGNIQPSPPRRKYSHSYGGSDYYDYPDNVKFYQPSEESLLVSSNIQHLYRNFK